MGIKAYRVSHGESGVYIEFELGPVADEALSVQLVLYDLARRGIQAENPGNLAIKMRKGETPVKVAKEREPADADMDAYVTISKDAMEAYMQLLPPCGEGRVKEGGEIIAHIQRNFGITEGLRTDEILRAVEQRLYYERILIAEGRAPEPGINGSLQYLFETKHSSAPVILQDGSADYKNLKTFTNVVKDDIVVTRTQATPGRPGVTVKGEVIEAKRGVEAKLPKGKNIVVSEDGNSLIAGQDGHIKLTHNRVEISNVYAVAGDVDMGVGNVDFVGDLAIQGNVIAGLTLKARGSIEVHGTVYASTLIAGGDIILKKGIQGADKAHLQAGGNVVCKFIERCHVDAGKSVFADYIVHSTINAGEKVMAQGRHARIIGGVLRAGRMVVARHIGSPTGEKTIIELGVQPELRIRLGELTKQYAQIKAQLEKLQGLSRVQTHKSADAYRQELWDKLMEGREQLEQTHDQLSREIEEIKQKLSDSSGGLVHTMGTVYPDVKITIGSAAYTTYDMVEFATFRYKDGEVGFSACEYCV
ncbi:MAG: FapA family protein [Christensenellales bacterium]|jgi:uncharacterized protein (DUF342 family)